MKTALLKRLAHSAKALADDSNIDGHRDDHRLASLELPSLLRLEVTSPSFRHGMPIPARHAGPFGTSPALFFSGVPVEAKQLALLCEDPDASPHAPFVHWIAYAIEPITKSIPEGIPPGPVGKGAQPGTAFKQGRNSTGHDGYFGPMPPAGDGAHHYHFQVFALNTTVSLAAGADREALIHALTGHVLASGDLVGTYRRPP